MAVLGFTGALSNATSANSSKTILAANAKRRSFTIYNDSTAILYVDLTGGVATTSSYSLQIPAGGYYESPGGVCPLNVITGLWASVNGNARVTEWA